MYYHFLFFSNLYAQHVGLELNPTSRVACSLNKASQVPVACIITFKQVEEKFPLLLNEKQEGKNTVSRN